MNTAVHPPMNITLIAATGRVGQSLLRELVQRGHRVTAVVRNPGKLPQDLVGRIQWVQDDLSDTERLGAVMAGADAVISAYGPPSTDPRYTTDVAYTDELVRVTERLLEAVRRAGVPRLLVAGGCGSLWFAPGVTVLESGHWPEPYRPIATSHMKALAVLRGSAINWTCLSPAMLIEPGERTGRFRLGGDDLIWAEDGSSRISMEDFAVALVDEAERPAHERARFTVGY